MREIVLLTIFATAIICLFSAHNANATSVVATINLGNFPNSATYDSAKGEVFVANQGTNSVSVIR